MRTIEIFVPAGFSPRRSIAVVVGVKGRFNAAHPLPRPRRFILTGRDNVAGRNFLCKRKILREEEELKLS